MEEGGRKREEAEISSRARLLARVAAFYDAMLGEHGATPKGVAWDDAVGQERRFAALAARLPAGTPVSVNDVGCGYGALFGFLDSCVTLSAYCGTDVCEAMVEAAAARIADPRARFAQAMEPVTIADWSLASGTFSLSAGARPEEWDASIRATLSAMARRSRLGFAFNMLRPGASLDPDVHTSPPGPWTDFCARFGRVGIDDNPAFPEWTIIVELPVGGHRR